MIESPHRRASRTIKSQRLHQQACRQGLKRLDRLWQRALRVFTGGDPEGTIESGAAQQPGRHLWRMGEYQQSATLDFTLVYPVLW